ncbi:MAG: sulfatase-like hydrolase/transferase [Planctomycetota bacterium]
MRGSRPNVVLIMSDQHNPHVMGCAGDRVIRTPNLDALAGEGIQLTNVYCPYPLCVPSRMAFMAAQYASALGVYGNGDALAAEVPTFAHALGAGGCEAVLCGRMHFVGPDQFHGFERRIVGDCQTEVLTPEILGSGNRRTNGQTKYAVEVSGYGRTGHEFFDRVVTGKACDFISSRRAGERPYVLVVGYMLPHNPLICSRELFDYYMDRVTLPEAERRSDVHPAVRKWRERRGCYEITPEQARRGRAAYYGLVEELDRNIGEVVRAARSSPQGKETVIIYCSDHGDLAGEHGMWWKSNFYEGSVRVPFIISQPGTLARGGSVDAVTSLVDVGPTVLDLLGAPALPDVAGKSFAGFLRGERVDDWPNEVFSECLGFHGDRPSCMLRSGPWKLIYYDEMRSCQLFNLPEDPGEVRDLAGDPAHKGVVEELLAKIARRWSAQRMLDENARAERARALLHRCGHPLMPHDVTCGIDQIEAHNEFNFDQLPWQPGR